MEKEAQRALLEAPRSVFTNASNAWQAQAVQQRLFPEFDAGVNERAGGDLVLLSGMLCATVWKSATVWNQLGAVGYTPARIFNAEALPMRLCLARIRISPDTAGWRPTREPAYTLHDNCGLNVPGRLSYLPPRAVSRLCSDARCAAGC
eukprot:3705942-Rhodomonas_salina.2